MVNRLCIVCMWSGVVQVGVEVGEEEEDEDGWIVLGHQFGCMHQLSWLGALFNCQGLNGTTCNKRTCCMLEG